MAKIEVKGTEIRVVTIQEDDYISLTDMLKAKDGDFFISDWLRNRNTVEYLTSSNNNIIYEFLILLYYKSITKKNQFYLGKKLQNPVFYSNKDGNWMILLPRN